MKVKLCGWAGCSAITTNKYYCDKHQTIADKRNAERKAKYNPFANATRYEQYKSPEWRRLSANVIKEVGCCERCGSKNNLQVHHLVAVRYAPERFLDRNNLMVLCRTCHQNETQREIFERRHRKQS